MLPSFIYLFICLFLPLVSLPYVRYLLEILPLLLLLLLHFISYSFSLRFYILFSYFYHYTLPPPLFSSHEQVIPDFPPLRHTNPTESLVMIVTNLVATNTTKTVTVKADRVLGNDRYHVGKAFG